MAKIPLGQTLEESDTKDIEAVLNSLTGEIPVIFMPPEGIFFEMPEGVIAGERLAPCGLLKPLGRAVTFREIGGLGVGAEGGRLAQPLPNVTRPTVALPPPGPQQSGRKSL